MNRTLFAAAAAVATVALVVPLVATADHRPGHKPNNPNPNLSIGAQPDTVLWGRAITITGRLRGSDNAGKTIELQQNPHPFSGAFKPASTTTTDAQGDYSFAGIRPLSHTLYRVKADLNPDETSEQVTVRVRMRINRRVDDRTPNRGDTVTFSGRVTPEHDGAAVLLQRRRASGSWRTMRNVTLEDAGPTRPNSSMYSHGIRIFRDGVWRARIKADEDHLGNKSRRVRIDVN